VMEKINNYISLDITLYNIFIPTNYNKVERYSNITWRVLLFIAINNRRGSF